MAKGAGPSQAEDYLCRDPSPRRWRGRELLKLTLPEDFLGERLHIVLSGRAIHLSVDSQLAHACGGVDELLSVLQATCSAMPDRTRFAAALPEGEPEIAALALDSGPALVEVEKDVLALNGALGLRPSLLRGLTAMALFQSLRRKLQTELGSVTLGRDLGALLIALNADPEAREELSNGRLEVELERVLQGPSKLVPKLRELLLRIPLRARRLRPEDNIYLDPLRFDGLPLSARLKVIAAGQLAWLTSLSFGLLGLAAPLFEAMTGYYSQARLALRGELDERGLTKTALRKRIIPALKRGRWLMALELFWSSWNHSLTRVTSRPFYRLMGGNKAPFFATLATFIFSCAVVHLMLPSTLLIALCFQFREQSSLAASLSTPSLIGIQATIWMVYASLGLVLGTIKAIRSRRSAT